MSVYDELVRREDVEGLILDKISKIEIQPVDEDEALAKSEVLQELLEEVVQ